MLRVCCRPGCSQPATATFSFAPADRALWLGDLAEDPGSDLCTEHADRLSPPRGWVIEDNRSVPVDDLADLEATSPMLSRAFRAARAS